MDTVGYFGIDTDADGLLYRQVMKPLRNELFVKWSISVTNSFTESARYRGICTDKDSLLHR